MLLVCRTIIVLAWWIAVPCAAQEAEGEAPAEGQFVVEPPSETDRERALRLFHEASDRYTEGRFADAVTLLLEARALYDDPNISYNLGRAYEELARHTDAADAYRAYLARAPNARDRAVIEARIERLTRQAERGGRPSEERGGARVGGTRPPTSEPGGDDGVDGPSVGLPLAIAAIGVATIGGGVVFGLLSRGSRSDAGDEPSHLGAREAFRRAEDQALIANALFVAGGVIAAIGTAWLVIALGSGGESATVALSPFGVSATGSW